MKNQFDRLKLVTAVILVAVFAMFGCGGSGGGSSSFKLFATDDLNPNYSGVWVKIFKADLKTSTGTSVNLFSSTDGLTVNLRALNDGAARFLLLAPGQVPDGSYSKIVFQLDKTVTLVAKPSGTVSTATFPTALDDPNSPGDSDLSLDFAPPLVVPGTGKVVVDFDLKNWVVAGGVITPVLHKHDESGIDDPDRHEKFEFHGILSSLSGTSPTQTFSLTLKSHGTVMVTTDDTTQLIFDGGLTALANGQKVKVFGAFNPLTNSIKAKIIRAESEFENEQSTEGVVSNPNAISETFTLTPSSTHGFVPQGETITVQTSSTTHYRGAHGANLTEAQFYTALAAAGANATAEVEGTYDSGSNTMTALSVHFESEADMGDAEAKGATTATVDANLGTFDLTASETDGFNNPGNPLHVAVTTTAEYRDNHGASMTKAEFFTAIIAGVHSIEIKGAYAGALFTASRLRMNN